jgi:hypothetical protein
MHPPCLGQPGQRSTPLRRTRLSRHRGTIPTDMQNRLNTALSGSKVRVSWDWCMMPACTYERAALVRPSHSLANTELTNIELGWHITENPLALDDAFTHGVCISAGQCCTKQCVNGSLYAFGPHIPMQPRITRAPTQGSQSWESTQRPRSRPQPSLLNRLSPAILT